MTISEGQKRGPVVFVSHGAGPLAILRDPSQLPLIDLCAKSGWVFDGCKGVIAVTAHWQEPGKILISSGAKPHLYYDYFPPEGADPMPEEAYQILYDAPGDPEIAHLVKKSVEEQGLTAVLDDERGWDHGVWTPMILIRPEADLPIVQVSIPEGSNVIQDSFALGRALEPLRNRGWAILASGHTYHNYDAIIGPILQMPGSTLPPNNREFETRLEEVATIKDLKTRLHEMSKWRTFPDADIVQPIGRDEHFTPFLVATAAGGTDAGKKLGEWEMVNTISSSYIWA